MLFKNRKDAGSQLADLLQKRSIVNGLVIGLPRGGVVVAYEIAKRLNLPLDVIIPRKIGAPFNDELAIGAVIEDSLFLHEDLIKQFEIDAAYIQKAIEKERREALRRNSLYRKGKEEIDFSHKTVLVVDDGIATGATMRVSLKYLQSKKPRHLIVAVPVGPYETIQALKEEGFDVVCLYSPRAFMAVGEFYEDFPQTSDEEVILCLSKSLS